MNVNDLYSDISSLWDNIYPILLFHIIFFLLYRFFFRDFSIKKKIKNYTETESYKNNKALLESFELWKKLPYLLLITAIVYFAVFNSVQSVITSVRVFPFSFSYSTTRFDNYYQPKEDLLTIASFGKDTVFRIYEVEEIKNKYLEEYKVKYPDKYESTVKWHTESFSKYARYLNLAVLLLLLLLLFFFRKITKVGGKRGVIIFRLALVMFCLLVVIAGLRYKAEQAIEEREIAEIRFVSVLLSIDKAQTPVLANEQQQKMKIDLSRSNNDNSFDPPDIWLSDLIGQSRFLQTLLGKRKLNITDDIANSVPLEPYHHVSLDSDTAMRITDSVSLHNLDSVSQNSN